GVPVELKIDRVLSSERDRDDAKIVDTQTCRLTSAAAPVVCPWTRHDGSWTYTASATVADARGRKNTTRYELPWYNHEDDERDLVVIPDRVEYRPGDVARLEIRSAVVPAT